MKSLCTTVLALFLAARTCSAQEPALSYGEKLKLYSTALGDSMEAYIYLPDNYAKTTDRYSIVYLLDGKYYFGMVSQAVRILNDAATIPPCILVGISSKNRERDFTTPPSKGFSAPMPMPDAGGIDKFLSFLQKELAPTVEKKYRTNGHRIIIGHSLAGIVAMYSLYKTPGFYNAHILADASLWWNNGEVGKNAIQFLKNNPSFKGKLFWVRDKIPREVWFSVNTEMHDYFTTQRPAGLDFTFTELENETHSTVIYPGAYMGLRVIFKGYTFPFTMETDAVAFRNYFDSLSANWGFKVIASEYNYNNLVQTLARTKTTAIALQSVQDWISAYPNSAWSYETSADLYWQTGEKEKAITHIRKALELDPNRASAKELAEKIR